MVSNTLGDKVVGSMEDGSMMVGILVGSPASKANCSVESMANMWVGMACNI